ncbi:hypothetical protein [Streptomyces hygroscopicus]|uniref:hypothetical protein n=1 Tax=Streptomyces hygroscopicus TaxID=1912 RepID=UPI0022400E85|nr:hypothetical protein [Streptomyces hygroscopicus]
MALFLEPDDLPESEYIETVSGAAGWQHVRGGHTCPSCTGGRGPVLERGECLRCNGRTVDLPGGNMCQYCGDVQPYADGYEDH